MAATGTESKKDSRNTAVDENSERVLNNRGADHGADDYFTTSWMTIESRDQVKAIYTLRELGRRWARPPPGGERG